MIEVASYPPDLREWKAQTHPYYLELGGETSPILDADFSGPTGHDASLVAPIYEYWWTIGHPGFRPQSPHWYDLFPGTHDGYTPWTHLREVEKNVAARVYMFFPRSGGWRIKEITAAVTYLTPLREHESLLNQAADEWSHLQPYVTGVAQLASAAVGTVSGGPLAGLAGSTAAKRAAEMLGTVAKAQLTSVPQTANLNWAVGKMTTHTKYGVMQGVSWTLPKAMFELLGGRITGTVSVSVIPAPLQKEGQVAIEAPPMEALPVLAHSVVYVTDKNGAEDTLWVPSTSDFVELFIHPKIAPDREPGTAGQ